MNISMKSCNLKSREDLHEVVCDLRSRGDLHEVMRLEHNVLLIAMPCTELKCYTSHGHKIHWLNFHKG